MLISEICRALLLSRLKDKIQTQDTNYDRAPWDVRRSTTRYLGELTYCIYEEPQSTSNVGFGCFGN